MLPLSVIICTYRREKAVGKTLALLFGPKVQTTRSVDLRVIVIDQGRTLHRANFPADWNLRLVHQDNLGGAGGFTRGMIEAINEEAGWILLMDDDATPDPASFPILATYIKKRAPDTRFALHGTMFSSDDPDTIYEAGASVKEPKDRNFDIVQHLKGYKPTIPIHNDPKLWENMEIDYGAWWFFCLHSDSIREAGLPLPLFIRGDDCEYGLRLQAHGIKTVPLPGVRVWHPVHSDRLDRWYVLFDWRNKFVTKALRGPANDLLLARTFWRRVFYRLLAAEYDLADLMIAGLREYLKGPAGLQEDQEVLVAWAKMLARRHVTTVHGLPKKKRDLTKVTHYRGLRRFLQTALLNGIVLPATSEQEDLPVFSHTGVDWLRLFRIPVYGVFSSSEQATRIHRRSPRTFWHLLGQLTIVVSRYYTHSSQLRRAWREEDEILKTATSWSILLNMAPTLSRHARL
jgi:galactofuranosylgalactofuranosylrhamnosyl-N-acetylglucosaminyl-diphospho-decaprenol beta-1,5/1,6-galactofuranosyltransferase